MLSLKEIQDLVEKEVRDESINIVARRPENLYIPVHYILGLKSKKLRPALVLAGYNLFSDNVVKALPAALAIEVFHNFTLLHDDIMDNADLRRNQPTTHRKFGENAAILSGDVMSFLSFSYLLQCETPKLKELISLFTETAIQVCEGQQFDMDFESRIDVSAEEYLNMIRLKTAVLLGCSLKTGAIMADADDLTSAQLYEFGINLGLAFQLQDDLLDTFGDENTFGKKIGGDIFANKKTYLLIKALELATPQQKSELMFWLGHPEPERGQKIASVISVYNQLGIRKIVVGKITNYIALAEGIIQDTKVGQERKNTLQSLVETVSNRNY
jgi:geranylgeranyl diphosphate synthase type II